MPNFDDRICKWKSKDLKSKHWVTAWVRPFSLKVKIKAEKLILQMLTADT